MEIKTKRDCKPFKAPVINDPISVKDLNRTPAFRDPSIVKYKRGVYVLSCLISKKPKKNNFFFDVGSSINLTERLRTYLSNGGLLFICQKAYLFICHAPSGVPINVGSANPSYGKTLDSAHAWNPVHSAKPRNKWSEARGKYEYWVYSATDFSFIQHFSSGLKLSSYFNFSDIFCRDIRDRLSKSGSNGIVYLNYIIITMELPSVDLPSIFNTLPIKPKIQVNP